MFSRQPSSGSDHLMYWVIILAFSLLCMTALSASAGSIPGAVHPNMSAGLYCEPQSYYGIQHCGKDTDDLNVLLIDLTDPYLRFQTVLSKPPNGDECNSVNGSDRDHSSNCSYPYPTEYLRSMLARYKDQGAVAIINTDYFGCSGSGAFQCGSLQVDHGAQGLAVRNGVRLDGPEHGVKNDIAYKTPSLAISPSNVVLIGTPTSPEAVMSSLATTYYNTVGGTPLLISGGAAISNPCAGAYTGDTCSRASQSAVAVTGDGKLILTTARLNATDLSARLLSEFPTTQSALKFDGGGSARMVWLDADGNLQTYGATAENRPVAGALMVFSQPVATSEVSFGAVQGHFYANPWNSGQVLISPSNTAEFTQEFPAINFNPPAGTVPCINNTGIDVRSRPFTAVVPHPDGSCLTIPAQGGGRQAGVGDLYNFQAVFYGTFTLSGPAQVTFNFYSDDGWILSAGPSAAGAQPSYVSGPRLNPPTAGPFTGYSVVGSYNTPSSPSQNNLIVNFPAGGRYPFELDYSECCGGELVLTLTAQGAPIPPGGSILGTVYRDAMATENALGGALVQACRDTSCVTTLTGSSGQYVFSSLAPGDYRVTAFPPTGVSLKTETIGPIHLVSSGSIIGQDIVLTGPTPPPSGTRITSRTTGEGGIPVVFWGSDLELSTTTCPGGTATYEVRQAGTSVRAGGLTEMSSGFYLGTISAFYPAHGDAEVLITIVCPNGTQNVKFDIYIDPSGVVRNVAGTPIRGATITLYRGDSAAGPFEIVPNGSGQMSISNRRNPDTSDDEGHFGWDVVAGYYKVRAEKEGCTAVDNATRPFVESAVLVIPPPVTDLDLRLNCPVHSIYLPLMLR
jgi:hypothetical protein